MVVFDCWRNVVACKHSKRFRFFHTERFRKSFAKTFQFVASQQRCPVMWCVINSVCSNVWSRFNKCIRFHSLMNIRKRVCSHFKCIEYGEYHRIPIFLRLCVCVCEPVSVNHIHETCISRPVLFSVRRRPLFVRFSYTIPFSISTPCIWICVYGWCMRCSWFYISICRHIHYSLGCILTISFSSSFLLLVFCPLPMNKCCWFIFF